MIAGACSTLVKAHAARARDARHGAGQLSLGAQRAPTCEACDDGWRRVEADRRGCGGVGVRSGAHGRRARQQLCVEGSSGGRSCGTRRTPDR